MKKSICLAASLLALNLTPVFGQQSIMEQMVQQHENEVAASKKAEASLTKFNLDFPGGTPAELVKAIEKATGKPMNTIVSDEDANVQLPPLKMSRVDVAQLFQALEASGRKDVSVYNQGFGSYSQQTIGDSFRTASGNLSEDSIWYIHVAKPTLPPVISSQKICQFYSLAPYLDRGFTVDDITTAIQAGWKMAGVTPPPELNYHKETKLLIAFGEANNLNIIRSVLDSLPSSNATRDEIDRMSSQIGQLQDQLAQLKKKIPSATPPSAAPEEKSGK